MLRRLGVTLRSGIRSSNINYSSNGVITRLYSNVSPQANQKPQQDDNGIESFKRNQTEYLFGVRVDPRQQKEHLERIANDPRLKGLDPNSPQYRYQTQLIHREIVGNNTKDQKKFERSERFKAMVFGIVLLVGIVSAHQTFMHWEYLKAKFTHKYYYKEVAESQDKVNSVDDPLRNLKSTEMMEKNLRKEISAIENLGSKVIDSREKSGLYLFGFDWTRLPARLNYFDGKFIKDVKLYRDFVVVVLENGEVATVANDHKVTPLNLPFKVEKSLASGDYVYFLTNKGNINYITAEPIQQVSTRTWYGMSHATTPYKTLETNAPVSDISSGQSHMLLLTKNGSVQIVRTSEKGANVGQYGIPQYSPFESESMPINVPHDIQLLNKELALQSNGSKYIRTRQFTSIDSGANHNVVLESSGAVWTWGQNNYGQCGIDVAFTTNSQPIPRKVIEPNQNYTVNRVFAGGDTTYLKCADDRNNQEFIQAFGNGLVGQLGVSRYLQVCSQPSTMKSITGLSEYDEKQRKVVPIGVKELSVGTSHFFVTLNNLGNQKDVMVGGDNCCGQYGNGKLAKSSKPVYIPKLLEPIDLDESTRDMSILSMKLNDSTVNRMLLLDGYRLTGDKVKVEQVIAAGDNKSALFYKRV
ncbi:uncharacterized protein KQ657_000016 [Scheffersomyces spartinae]|uniref:Uncharacterized protein n=1 Tax=Scheffersomyces spartinae TaxID=45513 RepID=A0A9P7VDV3_9ASCO|nr:uncharacterized protein KQ657_000016 [Scheffersomyces spartinae]KAG7196010.1 hypothetical protein KQ657_000016 [Scheffersomyces spartinae]